MEIGTVQGFVMKHTPFKIFIIVLIGGIIGIVGEFFMKYYIERLSVGHKVIVDDYFSTLSTGSEIRSLMYSHQAVIVKHTAADSEDKYNEYESEADRLENSLRDEFNKLGERMKGGEQERIYHRAYTNFHSYLQNADVTLEFSRAGSKNTADFYIVKILDDCTKRVNECLDIMNTFLNAKTAEAQNTMNGYISMSRVISLVSVILIASATAACCIFCVKITSDLDKYKNDLELDVERKAAALREHSEKMLQLQNSTIIGLANLIESRDGETGGHVKRTSKYVNMLANAARDAGCYEDELTDDYIDLLTRAAPLHDIGKIAISDSILRKPGKLSDEEYSVMKTHAKIGREMIFDVIGGIENEEYVTIAADIAAYHHEKWNGTGYSEGLSGEKIPLCARIMAIADVFDALISERCYKKAFSLDEAFGIIEDSAGSHFDPELARIFIGLREEIESYLRVG